jgi:tetratricopeptide (TPR) repeat protein
MGIVVPINYPAYAQKAAPRPGIKGPNEHNRKPTPAAIDKPRDPIDHFLKGQVYENRNDTVNAIREFELCLYDNFENDKAHLQLGILLMNKGELDGAISELGLAAIMDRKNEKARYYLGVCYFTERFWQDAADELNKALRIDPHDGEARSLQERTKNMLESEKQRAALREIMKVIDGCPKDRATTNKTKNP